MYTVYAVYDYSTVFSRPSYRGDGSQRRRVHPSPDPVPRLAMEEEPHLRCVQYPIQEEIL